MKTLVYARILLRVIAGVLIGLGLDDSIVKELSIDPDVIDLTSLVLGFVIWGIGELWYAAAKRFGWST